MRTLLILPLLAFLALSLGACAGAVPGNPQGYAGINKLTADLSCDTGDVQRVEVIGGKEQESVSFNVTTPAGLTAAYSATGVQAFDGARARAVVEQAVSSDVRAVAPDIVQTITDGLVKAFVPGAAATTPAVTLPLGGAAAPAGTADATDSGG